MIHRLAVMTASFLFRLAVMTASFLFLSCLI